MFSLACSVLVEWQSLHTQIGRRRVLMQWLVSHERASKRQGYTIPTTPTIVMEQSLELESTVPSWSLDGLLVLMSNSVELGLHPQALHLFPLAMTSYFPRRGLRFLRPRTPTRSSWYRVLMLDV